MISARLVLHSRNIRNALGVSSGPVSLYAAIITMLVESSALYAVNQLLFIIPFAIGSSVASIFSAVLGEIQVRAASLFPRHASILGQCLISEAADR